MTRSDNFDGQATSERAVRRKNQRTRQARRVLARAEWLEGLLVFWSGEPQEAPRLAGAPLPLRAVLEDRLAAVPAGLYSVRVGFPESLSATQNPGGTAALAARESGAGGPLRLEVTAVDSVMRERIATTARAIEAVARYPKVAAQLIGPVDGWHRHAVVLLDAARRAVEGLDAWRTGAPASLALESRVLWLGSVAPPSATLAVSALSSWGASEHGPSAALAAIALGQRRFHGECPVRLAVWAAAGRALDRWPAAAVARAANGVGADVLATLAAATPILNDPIAALWIEERTIDGAVTTKKELVELGALVSSLAAIRHEPSRRHELLSRLAMQYLQLAWARVPGQAAPCLSDMGERFRDLAVDQVYAEVREPATACRQRLPASIHDLAECWIGTDFFDRKLYAYVDYLLASAAVALGKENYPLSYDDPPTSLSQHVPAGSLRDSAGATILVTIAHRLRWKGASNACAAMKAWLDACRSLIRLDLFWRDVFSVVPSGTARFDAESASALASSLERHARFLAAELAFGSSEQAGTVRALLPTVLARGPDATGRVLRYQLWLPDDDALDAALRWVDETGRARAKDRQDQQVPLPRAAFEIADAGLRDTLLAMGVRVWTEGDASASEVEQLMSVLGEGVSRYSSTHWTATRSALVNVVVPVMRQVSRRTPKATASTGFERLHLVHIILDVCARWTHASFDDALRLSRCLADRWTSASAAAEEWSKDDDHRNELITRLSEGRIARFLILLRHPSQSRQFEWRALDSWALVAAHPIAHGWVSACLDRPKLVARVVRMLDRLALVARLDPGLTARRFFGPLERASGVERVWPRWVPSDVRTLLDQVAQANATTESGDALPGAVRRLLERGAAAERERTVLRERAASTAVSRSARARLDKLERLVANPESPSADVCAELRRALPKHVALAGLAAVESLVRHDLERRWHEVIGVDHSASDDGPWDNALHMVWSVKCNRRVLVRLLRNAARGDRMWMRDLGPNRSFLAAQAAAGTRIGEWMKERSVSIPSPTGPLTAYATTDPLEVLQMGSLFGTCLSAGKFNAHAAVAAAVEVNKRVLYVRDRRGLVIGRQLLALTQAGEMMGFTSYGARAEDPGKQGPFVKLALELLALDIVRASGTSLMPRAHMASGLSDDEEESLMLFCRGYVDSLEPFDWWIEALAAADPRSGEGDRTRVRSLLQEPVPADLDARTCADWQRDELGWAACRALLWLGAEAPSLSPEQQAALGLSARHRLQGRC